MITDPAKFTYETIDRLIELKNSEEFVQPVDLTSEDYIDSILLWEKEFDNFLGYIMDTYDAYTVIRMMNTILSIDSLCIKDLNMNKISNFQKFHRNLGKIIIENGDKIQALYPKYTRDEANAK